MGTFINDVTQVGEGVDTYVTLCIKPLVKHHAFKFIIRGRGQKTVKFCDVIYEQPPISIYILYQDRLCKK